MRGRRTARASRPPSAIPCVMAAGPYATVRGRSVLSYGVRGSSERPTISRIDAAASRCGCVVEEELMLRVRRGELWSSGSADMRRGVRKRTGDSSCSPAVGFSSSRVTSTVSEGAWSCMKTPPNDDPVEPPLGEYGAVMIDAARGLSAAGAAARGLSATVGGVARGVRAPGSAPDLRPSDWSVQPPPLDRQRIASCIPDKRVRRRPPPATSHSPTAAPTRQPHPPLLPAEKSCDIPAT